MRKFRWSMQALFLLLALAGPALAGVESAQPPAFHRLPLDGALTQNSVTHMLQDRSGLMWFATLDRVNVYDGYEFRSLSADPRDPNRLSGVLVSRLFEDREGGIWIAGFLGWLDRLDPKTGKVRHFPRELFGPANLPGAYAPTGFHQSPSGMLWIGTSRGLHRYDPGTDKLEMHADAQRGRPPLANVGDIIAAEDGKLWLASGTGLHRFDPATRALESFRTDAADATTLPGNAITTLHRDPDGTLWVGTVSGLARWEGEGRGFTRFVHDPADPQSLGGDWVMDILRDRKGRLWVGSQTGGGLSLYADGRFQVFRNDRNDPESIVLDDIWSLYEDRSGLLWIGTAGGGLNQINPSAHRFHALRAIPFNENSLRSGFVWAIEEDAGGRIWMATLAGIESYEPATQRFEHFAPQPGSVAGNQMQALRIDRSGRFWVGAVDGRMYRFEPGTGQFSLVRNPARNDDYFSRNRIWYFAEDADGRIWLSTTAELVALDPATAQIVERVPASGRIPLGPSAVRASLVDSDGVFWMGGGGAGLIRYERGKGVTAVLSHDPRDPASLSENGVRTLHEAADGSLWVGTQNGLNRMDAADRRAGRNRFKLYAEAEGLGNSTAYGILPDRDQRIWLSTNRGLSLIDPVRNSVRNFDFRDGLVGDEMNGGAERVSRDGTYYFGGVSGVTWFRPEELATNTHVPQVRITRIDVAGRPAAGMVFAPRDELDLKFSENTVSLTFASMDFHQPTKNRFRYRLTGQSDRWTETSRNSVNLAKLSHGKYRFEVIGSNNDGVWSRTPAHLAIVVRPPWWQTPLAFGLYALALALLVLFYDRVQRRKLKREREYSESLASAHSLAEANHQMALRYAQFDALTQLPNRSSLIEALGRYLRFARSQHRQIVLLLINLDRFQRINDTLGHSLGDQVLKVTAERLQHVTPPADLLARAGSDEFAAICVRPPGQSESQWLDELIARITAAIGEPHVQLDPPLSMTASIGIAFPHGPSDSPSDLLGYANIAMHAAKRLGGKRAERYVPGMIESAREKLGMEARIRRALEGAEFLPWYQPIIDLRRNRVVGFEALIRWQPPGQGMIFPDQFIPVAEESGLVVDLGNFMILEACRQLAIWQRDKVDLTIAINVSMRQLRSGMLIKTIRHALAQTGVSARLLKLEITESAMMENVEDTAEQLREIKDLGLGISIDDFGTGFSSMSHLKLLPVDEMKIDRSFVSDVVTSPHSQKIVNSIVRLAHELGLVVVAEGVETEEIQAYLKSVDCDRAQGYLYGRPVPADKLPPMLGQGVRGIAA